MQKLNTISKRMTAAAVAGMTAALCLSAQALADSNDVSLNMSMYAGGSRIGMEFTVSGAGNIGDYAVYLDDTELEPTSAGTFVADENAMNMTKVHTVSVVKDGTEVKNAEISVRSYLQEILNTDSYSDYHALAKAILMYGGAAQEYFNADTDHLASAGITGADYADVSVNATAFDKEAFNAMLADAPVSYYGMNLSLLSETTFRLFFRLNTDTEMADAIDYLDDFTFGNSSPTIKENGSNYVEVYTQVPASKLSDTYTFTNQSVSADFSPEQYIAAAIASDQTALSNVCKALYAYGEAVNAVGTGTQPVSNEKWESDTVHSGRLTFYDYEKGCANLDDYIADNELYIAALTNDDANEYEKYIGGCIEVTYRDKSVYAIVGDIMPVNDPQNQGRQAGDVDLNRAASAALGLQPNDGDLDITWRIVPLPTADDQPISYIAKEGTSIYWGCIQVRNTTYPVAKLEFTTGDGNYTELDKKRDGDGYFINYYVPPTEAFGAEQVTFRITDIYGQTVIDENVQIPASRVSSDTPISGSGVQLPK